MEQSIKAPLSNKFHPSAHESYSCKHVPIRAAGARTVRSSCCRQSYCDMLLQKVTNSAGRTPEGTFDNSSATHSGFMSGVNGSFL